MGRGALQYLVSKTEPNRRSTLRTRHEKTDKTHARGAYPRIAVHIHGSQCNIHGLLCNIPRSQCTCISTRRRNALGSRRAAKFLPERARKRGVPAGMRDAAYAHGGPRSRIAHRASASSLALGHRIRDRATTGWRVSMSMQTLVSESRAEQSRADINSSNLRRLRIQYPCLAQTRASPWATRPEASEEAGTRAGIPYCISAVPYRTQLLYL